MLPSQFAEVTGRPDRVIALHFHLPVWVSNLADVMPHAGTRREVTERVLEFARQIGQVPIELRREHHGYVFNAMYTALNREAITMAEQGVASIEDIDRAWMHVSKWPHGPFGALDAVGLDTAWQITDYWARELRSDLQLRRNAEFPEGLRRPRGTGREERQGFLQLSEPGVRSSWIHRDGIALSREVPGGHPREARAISRLLLERSLSRPRRDHLDLSAGRAA